MLHYENKNFYFDNPITYNLKYVVKYVLCVVKDILYKLLFYISKKPLGEKTYQYSICSIFKNEAPFIKEWIEYHRLLGFDHFYLYQNNSSDNYLEILQDYIDNGIVTLIEWPDHPGQLTSIQHWYSNFRTETQWVSFLDLDEFFCPKRVVSIDQWMKPFKRYPLVLLYWQMFGTNGNMEHDINKPVIEQYTNSWAKKDSIGKLIYNTDYEISSFFVGMIHNFNVIYKGIVVPPINQYGYFVSYNVHRYSNKDDVQINHYWSKSYDTYISKHKRGSCAYGKSWKTFDQFLRHEHFNTSSNFVIYRFLVELKLKLRGEYPES